MKSYIGFPTYIWIAASLAILMKLFPWRRYVNAKLEIYNTGRRKDLTVLIRFTYKHSWHLARPLQPKFIEGSNLQLTPTLNLYDMVFPVLKVVTTCYINTIFLQHLLLPSMAPRKRVLYSFIYILSLLFKTVCKSIHNFALIYCW